VQRVAAALALLVNPFMSGLRIAALVRAWRRGLRMGRQAEFVLDQPLEDWFERPLWQVRADLGIVVLHDDNAPADPPAAHEVA